MKDYLFLRLSISSSDKITKELCRLALDGWKVVSHSEQDGEYSFVLERSL